MMGSDVSGEGGRDETIGRMAEELRALRAEVADLRGRHATSEAIIDRLPLAYIRMDAGGRVLEWNPAAERMFGYTAGEAVGRRCLELIVPPPVDGAVQRIMDRLRAGDMDARSVNENRTRDGRTITCEWFNTPLSDAGGRFAGAISLAQDITERMRTEEALAESRRRYRAVFEHALDGILLTDDAGRCVDGNPAICRLLGYSREELANLTIRDIMPARDREQIPGLLARFLGGGTLSGECALSCKGGATREVEFRSAANILPGLHLSIFCDVTDRRRAERALRESEERFRFLTESIPHMVWAACPAGDVVYCNARLRDYLGLAPEQVLGRAWAETVHPDDRGYALDAWRRSLRDGAELRIEYRLRDGKTGGYRWFIGHALPQRDPGSRVVRWFGTCTDIDERKRAERELRDYASRLQVLSRRVVEVQEEERRHLARELHDEIGQALTAIGLGLQALRRSCGGDALLRLEECIGIVDRTIDQVRDLALDLRPSLLDDLGLVPALRWHLDRQARRAGYRPVFDADPGEIHPEPAAATAAFRVAQEALTNVARHAGASWVWVRLRLRGGALHLTVRDDGVGFDPTTVRRRGSGARGLGLLGMRERAALLGGRVAIRSAPGRGTVVRLTLPPGRAEGGA